MHNTLICPHCGRLNKCDMARCVCGKSLKDAENLDLWPEYMHEWVIDTYGRKQ